MTTTDPSKAAWWLTTVPCARCLQPTPNVDSICNDCATPQDEIAPCEYCDGYGERRAVTGYMTFCGFCNGSGAA